MLMCWLLSVTTGCSLCGFVFSCCGVYGFARTCLFFTLFWIVVYFAFCFGCFGFWILGLISGSLGLFLFTVCVIRDSQVGLLVIECV